MFQCPQAAGPPEPLPCLSQGLQEKIRLPDSKDCGRKKETGELEKKLGGQVVDPGLDLPYAVMEKGFAGMAHGKYPDLYAHLLKEKYLV